MNQDTLDQVASACATHEKRPYLKPSFQCESVFETMALACGKLRGQTTQDQCRRSAATS